MVSKLIENRVKEFIGSLSGLNKAQSIASCKNEVKELSKLYKGTYLRTIYTEYRSGLSDITYLKSIFKIKESEQNKIQNDYSKKLSKQHKELIRIKNVEGLVSTALQLLESDNLISVVLGLCLLTGRRSTEILKTAKFTNHKKSNNMLMFSGQLKKRDSADTYGFYTLGNSAKSCKIALKKVRSMVDLKNVSNNDVSIKYEKQLLMKCTLLFGDYLGRCSAHDLRKAYATICQSTYKPNNQSVNYFLSQILGHNEDDISTANSYQKYFI